MSPNDDRHGTVALGGFVDVDAQVQCAALVLPVINSLFRYRHAHRFLETSESAGCVGRLPEFHYIYLPDEDAMAEGNSMIALLRGETLEMPPVLWL